ncbi:MAG: hypothetical protein RSB11_06855 [Oscillospiraceae bacterium]
MTLFPVRTFDHQIAPLRCGVALPLSVLCTDNLWYNNPKTKRWNALNAQGAFSKSKILTLGTLAV